MEVLMEHWLSIGTGIFLLAMILYGHYRGFLQMAVAMSALIISILFVRTATPYITSFLKENTKIHQMIQESLIKASGAEELLSRENEYSEAMSAGQRMIIEKMKIPDQMKNILLDNNNSEVYRVLGVENFIEYIGAYLSDMILKLAGSIILFIIVYIVLRVVIRALNLVSRLPVLHGINQIAGALLGCIRGLFWLWAAFIAVDLCSGTSWSGAVLAQIYSSVWLGFLYHNNLLNWMLIGIFKRLI